MPKLVLSIAIFALSCGLFWAQSVGFAQTKQFELRFVDGNVVTVEGIENNLAWKTIEKNGTVVESTVPWSSVSKLTLSNSPAFALTEQIGLLLNQLQDPNYLVREAAEQDLAKPETGGGFREMISIYGQSTDSLEAKIRTDRILSRLKESQKRKSVEFDELFTKGNSRKGDAGNFEFKVKFRGNEVNIRRAQLTQILAVNRSTRKANAI